MGNIYWIGHKTLSEETKVAINDFSLKYSEQRSKIIDMRRMLEAAIFPITTRERLLLAFPEFEDYLLDALIATKNLPVLTGVMDGLKALGWVEPVDAEAVPA